MVAKGHDFPEVTLSVVLDADATLRFPDFRAEERTFALVAQLAGRSGRGERGRAGARPDAGARTPGRFATPPAHDAAGFLAGELERRRALRYPPFSHLVRIELDVGGRRARPERPRRRLATALDGGAAGRHRAARPGAAVPAPRPPPPPAPAQGRATGRRTVAAVRDAVEGIAAGRALRGVALSVDVDPQ